MLSILYEGWFQCRLATDPDPYDESRGVSGYVRAYADEPDLDRIISFQKPAFVRTLGPQVGVAVREIRVNGVAQPGHVLAGARVNLERSPVFEGRNGVIAEDGLEPIYPFQLSVATESVSFTRQTVAADHAYPFPEFLASGVELSPPEFLERVGLKSGLQPVWTDRIAILTEQLASAVEPQRTGIEERLTFLHPSSDEAIEVQCGSSPFK